MSVSAAAERFLVISTMKNEGPYILEWLAHHRAIGFTDFLVFTNDCTDGTDLLLDRLTQRGLVVHERNQVLRRGPHKSALKHAFAQPLYAEAGWVFVADSDEFLNIRTGAGRVTDLVRYFPGADAVPVTWRMFSNAGLVGLPEGLVTECLTDAEPDTPAPGAKGRFVKTLFRRSGDIVQLGLHGPHYAEGAAPVWGSAERAADPGSDPLRPARLFGYEVAQVNHYAVRTVDAYLIKRDRGRANHVGETLGAEYWDRWCRGGARDVSIHRHLPALRCELDMLRDDPVTAALDRAAREMHARRLDALRADPAIAELRAALVARSAPHSPAAAANPAAGADSKAAAKPAAGAGSTAGADDAAEALLQEVRAETAAATRAPRRHALRQTMLAELMPKGARCAEIGVWAGAFSAEILHHTRPAELVLIDPWDLLAEQTGAALTHKRHSDAEAMRGMYERVTRLYGARPDCTIRRGFSTEVLAEYPDGHFDWVYIDGNHRYDYVRRDLETCFAKTRPGGIVAGDDFFWKREGRLQVREAVFDALRARGQGDRFSRRGQQFIIQLAG